MEDALLAADRRASPASRGRARRRSAARRRTATASRNSAARGWTGTGACAGRARAAAIAVARCAPGSAWSGSPIPSEITSTPAARFSLDLALELGERVGLDLVEALRVGHDASSAATSSSRELAREHRLGPARSASRPARRDTATSSSPPSSRTVTGLAAPPQHRRHRGAATAPGAGRQRLPHPALEDARAHACRRRRSG